jgi:uncharacterized protein (TIGR03437 family)
MRTTIGLLILAVAASAQNVRITWIGQACFYVQTEEGPIVVVDPPAANIGYTLPATPADAVTVSHNHGDHNFVAGVRGTPTLVDGRPTTQRTQMTAAGLPFVLIPGFHDNANGTLRGNNTIVQWTQGGLRFAHFGDYGQDALTEAQAADLRDIDIMMVPGGGGPTADGAAIARIIDQLKPRVAILMHYRTGVGGPAQLAGHPAVATPFPMVQYKPASVTVSKSVMPLNSEVWVMEPVAEAAVVPAAGFTGGAPVAPAAIASVFGDFSGSATASYSSLPLPRQLGQTQIFIGNQAVPLFHVSPGQINFQVPAVQAPGQETLEVRIGSPFGQRVVRAVLTTVASSPALFVAVDQAGRINRVKRGEFLTIYATGQGLVTPAVAEGIPPSANPTSVTPGLPGVLVGTIPARVTFSGMAPGFPGLWQINAQVAADAPTGETDLTAWFSPNLVSNALKVTVE